MSFLTGSTGFPVFSRKWEFSSIPDLSGRVCIVTGGNTGLGYVTCLELLRKGAKVYLACRSEERATAAITRLVSEVPESKERVFYLPFDLTDLKSATSAANEIMKKETRLDVIVASAAVMAWPYKLVNGLEVQFWNHLGHYALIQPLLPLMISTSKLPDSHVRIINVSSIGHQFTPRPDFTSVKSVNARLSNTWARYGQSKLANILYTKALQKHLGDEKIRVLCLHPGNVHTELTRGPVESFGVFGKIMQFASGYLAMSVASGSKTQVYAAVSPEVDELDLKGAYLLPIATVATPSNLATDSELAEQLWRWSEMAIEELKDFKESE